MKILIIGGGVHGLFLSYFLKKKSRKNNIIVVEKNSTICSGSSSATHNRANRGFHYPRSEITSKECRKGWNFFRKNFPDFFYDIKKSYYFIEKKSHVSKTKYENFLKKNKYSFKKKYPKSIEVKKDNLTECFQVFEGCFNHNKVINFLNSQIKINKIKLVTNFNLKKIYYNKKNNKLHLMSGRKKIVDEFDKIINATYDNVNKIDKLFDFQNKYFKYKIQYTLIPVIETNKKEIPGLTIMDGKFITIMPKIGYKNQYLVYDVVNSVSYKKINNIQAKKRFKKMKIKLNKYFNFDFEYKLIDFIRGNRPIPINDTQDRRSTIIEKKKFFKSQYYNIREGKYISAPLIAYNLARKI